MDQPHQFQQQQYQNQNGKVGVIDGGGGGGCNTWGNQVNLKTKNSPPAYPNGSISNNGINGNSSINVSSGNSSSFSSSSLSSPSGRSSSLVVANGKSSGGGAGEVVLEPLRKCQIGSASSSSFHSERTLNGYDGICSVPNDDSPFQNNWHEEHQQRRIVQSSATGSTSFDLATCGGGLNRFQQKMQQQLLQRNGHGVDVQQSTNNGLNHSSGSFMGVGGGGIRNYRHHSKSSQRNRSLDHFGKGRDYTVNYFFVDLCCQPFRMKLLSLLFELLIAFFSLGKGELPVYS
jgi:hypothetical protein